MEHISNQLQNLNLEPQKPESTKPKGGEDSFEVAIQQQKISNTSYKEVREALMYAMVKVGLRAQNWPTEEEKVLLMGHVIQFYGGHTIAEIRLAFDMAIQGKLEVDPNCYENFSCLYFSGIMNAYREWAKDQYKEIKPKMIENTQPLTNQTMQDWYEDTKAQVKKRTLSIEFIPLQLYEWAMKEQIISASVAQKWDYLRQAIEYRQAQLYADMGMDGSKKNIQAWSEFMKMKTMGEFYGDELTRLRNLARKMLLFDEMLK